MVDDSGGEWIRWFGGGLFLVFSGICGVFWRQINATNRNIDERLTSLDGKFDDLVDRMTEHELSDERSFARRDEAREMYRELKEQIDALIAREDRNFGVLLERLDRLTNRGR